MRRRAIGRNASAPPAILRQSAFSASVRPRRLEETTLIGVSVGETRLIAAFADNPEITCAIVVHVRQNIEDFALTDPIWQKREEELDLNRVFTDEAYAIDGYAWVSEPAGLVEYDNGTVRVLTDQECEVTIYATSWDGGITKHTDLTIYRPAVEEITIDPVNEWNWVESYSDVQMTARVKATDWFVNQLVTWSVESGSSGASIDQNGVLHTGSGWRNQITVTATADNGVQASYTLYSVYPTESFTLPERIAIQTGETVTVKPEGAYCSNTGDLSNSYQNYTMSVGTARLAQVEGMTLTGLAPGRTELTVRSWNGTEVKTEVLVYDPIETIDVSRIESLNGKYSLSAPKTDLYVQMNYRAHSRAVSDRTYTDDLVTWTSSDPTVVRVEDAVTGAFRTVNYGTATLTATAANGVVGTIELNVREEVKTFTLSDPMTAYILSDQVLTAQSITEPTAYDGFLWSVEPASVGTVEGQVLHVAADQEMDATLTATSWDGYVTKRTTLHIRKAPVTAVALEPYGTDELGVGGDYALIAHVTAGAEYENRFVTFTSSDESILTVDPETGVAHAHAAGEATITVAAQDDPSISDGRTFTCVQGVESFTVTPEAVTVYVGETARVEIGDILPEDAMVRDFTWSVSPEGIATVTDGVITPTATEDAEGTLTVTSWNGVVPSSR